ncbi:MAG: hypothetical protein V4667_05385 [Bacteroidota bacterium]
MKIFIVFILLIFTTALSAQTKLKGEYCRSSGFEGECFTFKNNNKFDYSFWSCTGGKRGEGDFSLVRDTLVLNFKKSKTEFRGSKFTVKESAKSQNDSIVIEVTLYDELTGELIPFAVLALDNKQFSDSLSFIKGVSTDIDGKAFFKIKKNDNNIWLKCIYIGVSQFSIQLNGHLNYNIVGNVSFFNIKTIENETYFYNIDKVDKKKLTYKIKDEEGKDYFINLYKKSRF